MTRAANDARMASHPMQDAMSQLQTDGIPERVVRVYLRTVLILTATLVAVFSVLYLLWLTRQILIWLLIAVLLAVALDPLVRWFQRRVQSRTIAVIAAILVVLASLVAIGLLIVPALVDQINDLSESLPNYIDDLASGRGPLGFLESDYHIVERVRERLQGGGTGRLAIEAAGGSLLLVSGTLSTLTAVGTIAVMVVFLLLGGPRWVEAFYAAMPDDLQLRWRRLAGDLYASIGGYVRGNFAISGVAGVTAAATLLILGVPYAFALALMVAIFDLVPLVGATIGASLVFVVAVSHSLTAGIVWVIFAICYQQLENHFLQPVVYGRTVLLPAFGVFVAVLAGAKLGGIVGALFAIPVASGLQIIVTDVVRERRAARARPAKPI
jgi:predicted PurR-regulated permease PerM